MEQQEIPTQPSVSPAPGTSLGARIFNVFASPAEVFDEVKSSAPSVGNWIVPLILCILTGIIFTFIVFSQPNIQQQLREAQDKAIQQKVADGKMTQAQADQAEEIMNKWMGPSMLKMFGIIGSVVANPIRLFWWSFVVWGLGRWILKGGFSYMKAVEAVGLTTMISVLGAIVSLLMIVSFGRMSAGPTLAFNVEHFDATNKVHTTLAAANVFNFWFVAVAAAGLARLASTSYIKAAALVFACWLGWEAFLIVIGMGQMAM